MSIVLRSGLAVLLLSTCAVADADVALEQSLKIEARGLISVFESEQTILTEISGDRSRIESSGETLLISLSDNLAWMLHPDQQQFSVLSLGEKRLTDARDIEYIEQVPQSGLDALPITESSCQWTPPQINVDRTGERKRIAEIRAEQYLITAASTCNVPSTRQSCDVTWVLDYWNARRMPGDRELADFRRELANQLGTTELLAMTPIIPRGLLGLFDVNWEEIIYEADGLKGFPVKTIMSLHIGGKNCRTRSNDELTRDTVWSGVKNDSLQATKNQAANQVGNVIAQETARQVGGSFGGVLVSSVMGILGRNAASKAMEKKAEEPEPVPVADENVSNRIAGQVQIFRITTELLSVSDARIPSDRLEIPADWEDISNNH